MPPLWERPANLWPTSCHIIWVPGGISMSYVFDPEVVLHWDLFQKESPGSSERSFERKGIYSPRLFEILYDNDRLCSSNIIRLRYFEILGTGYVFTFIRVIFLTLILWIIWEVITGNWGPSGNKLRKEEGWAHLGPAQHICLFSSVLWTQHSITHY